jgi:tetratricopeptide (TPR) repeat protein
LKLFLSYGHDHNAPLVERIRDGLKAAGHEVWMDTSAIKAGEDWRRSILDGLADTDWVLGFLSKHSTRDPGVCLDELSIALHGKGGAIATVLVEGEAAVDPPVTVSHLQWLDMHDWQERLTGEAGETWYNQKFAAILAMLENPVTQRFAGEIKELEARLLPVSQMADIGTLIDRFTGRSWLRDLIDQWRDTARDSRLLWISGGAGTGKSAFAAWLSHLGRVNVIGLNLCSYNMDDRRDAGRVIRTLAFQMATRLPDYRRLILEKLRTQDPTGNELANKSPTGMFNYLIIEPLRLTVDGGRSTHRYLIVIDALDETVRDGRSELTEVLAAEAAKLPAWIAMLVTSRPEEPILRQFAGLQPVTIKAESAENIDDLRVYARAWLGADAASVERVVAASEGNFLYLRMLRDAVAAGTMSLEAPEGLPQGLAGLYERWFRHRFPNDDAYERYVPLLEVIVAAGHPVPVPWLARIFNWSKRETPRMLEGLGSLFEQRKDGVAPFHKSLRDWLIDDRLAGAAFVVDKAEGTARLIDALWGEFCRWAALPDSGRGDLDEFCVAELPGQVVQLNPAESRARLGAEAGWEAQKHGLVAVALAQARSFSWERALAWWRMIARLSETLGEQGAPEHGYALGQIGDISIILGRSAAALEAFSGALRTAQNLADTHPENPQWQRDLSVFITKHGDVCLRQGRLPEALDRFRRALEIRDGLVRMDAGNPGWRDDLASAHRKVGDVLEQQGKVQEALAHFEVAYAVMHELVQAIPDAAAFELSLYYSANKIGQLLQNAGKRAEARNYFGAGLGAISKLCAADPDNTARQHELYYSHTRMGEMLAVEDPPQAAQHFNRALEILERLTRTDPGNLNWQDDLATAQDRLATGLLAQGRLEEALDRFRGALSISIRVADSDPGNAVWQRNLAASYDRMGETLAKLGDLPTALAQFQQAFSIHRDLAQTQQDNMSGQMAFAMAHDRIGMLLAQQGDALEALNYLCDGLEVFERVAQADPQDVIRQRHLGVRHHRIGTLAFAHDAFDAAMTHIRTAVKIGDALVKADPGDARLKLDLAIYREALARGLFQQGDTAQGLEEIQQAHDITGEVARHDRDNAEWQHSLALSHCNLGTAFGMAGERRKMLEHLCAGRDILTALLSHRPAWRPWQQELAALNAQIASLGG